jgi:hypothetical protein
MGLNPDKSTITIYCLGVIFSNLSNLCTILIEFCLIHKTILLTSKEAHAQIVREGSFFYFHSITFGFFLKHFLNSLCLLV